MAAPNFNGDDAKGWKHRCEEFFLIDETPDNRKVRYAAIKFEGRALHWHQLYAQTTGKALMDMSWDDYSRSTLLYFGEEPELEGTNHETEISSLCSYFQDVVVDVNEMEVESEKEMSAHQVFDEMPNQIRPEMNAHQVFDEMSDQVLDEIETQYSDIFICRSILSENSVGFVDKEELSSESETSAYKVFDESFGRVSGEINDKFEAHFSDRSACRGINEVIVMLDDSSNLVDKHFRDQIRGLSQNVIVKFSCDKIWEFSSSSDILCCVYTFWGQKSLKKGVLGMGMVMHSFGWKPGWLHCLGNEIITLEIVKELEMVKSIEEVSDDVIVTRIKLLSKNDVAKRLFVFSNLEFDQASNDSWKTDYEALQRKFKNGGCEEVLGIVLVLGTSRMDIASFGWKPGWINLVKNSNEVHKVVPVEIKKVKWFKRSKLLIEMLIGIKYMAGAYDTQSILDSIVALVMGKLLSWRRASVVVTLKLFIINCSQDQVMNLFENTQNSPKKESRQQAFCEAAVLKREKSTSNGGQKIMEVSERLSNVLAETEIRVIAEKLLLMKGSSVVEKEMVRREREKLYHVKEKKRLQDEGEKEEKWDDLLRYHSKISVDKVMSLKEYTTRMKEGQKHIDYIMGETKRAAGRFFHKWGNIEFPLFFGGIMSATKRFIRGLDGMTSASWKFTFLNPKRRIWTMVVGGGASLIYFETIGDPGYTCELGNYAEYNRAPNKEEVFQNAGVIIDEIEDNRRGYAVDKGVFIYAHVLLSKLEARLLTKDESEYEVKPQKAQQLLSLDTTTSESEKGNYVEKVYHSTDDELMTIHCLSVGKAINRAKDFSQPLAGLLSNNITQGIEKIVALIDNQCQLSEAAVDNGTQGKSDLEKDSGNNLKIIEANANVLDHCAIVVKFLAGGFIMKSQLVFCGKVKNVVATYLQKQDSAFDTKRAEPELPNKKGIRI